MDQNDCTRFVREVEDANDLDNDSRLTTEVETSTEADTAHGTTSIQKEQGVLIAVRDGITVCCCETPQYLEVVTIKISTPEPITILRS